MAIYTSDGEKMAEIEEIIITVRGVLISRKSIVKTAFFSLPFCMNGVMFLTMG